MQASRCGSAGTNSKATSLYGVGPLAHAHRVISLASAFSVYERHQTRRMPTNLPHTRGCAGHSSVVCIRHPPGITTHHNNATTQQSAWDLNFSNFEAPKEAHAPPVPHPVFHYPWSCYPHPRTHPPGITTCSQGTTTPHRHQRRLATCMAVVVVAVAIGGGEHTVHTRSVAIGYMCVTRSDMV